MSPASALCWAQLGCGIGRDTQLAFGAVCPVDLMTEIIGDDRSVLWVPVAARWVVMPERYYLDTSWGMQTDSARSRQITIGFKSAF